MAIQPQFGDYILLSPTPIATGGFAEIYLARDPILKQNVVIKLLHFTNDQAIARFKQEGPVTARVRHPYIVNILKVAELDPKRPYIVQEFIDGEDLSDFIDSSKRYAGKKRPETFSLRRITKYLFQIAQALQYVHSCKVYHRDINASNIRIHKAADIIKLLDFGIAKDLRAAEPLTTARAVLATIHFASPEQLNSSRDVDDRSDIYSFCVLAFMLLTGGKHPYLSNPEASELSDVLDHIRDPRPPVREYEPNCPVELDELVLKGMEPDPEERWDSLNTLLPHIEKLYHRLSLQELNAAPSSRSFFSSPALDYHHPRVYPSDREASSSVLDQSPTHPRQDMDEAHYSEEPDRNPNVNYATSEVKDQSQRPLNDSPSVDESHSSVAASPSPAESLLHIPDLPVNAAPSLSSPNISVPKALEQPFGVTRNRFRWWLIPIALLVLVIFLSKSLITINLNKDGEATAPNSEEPSQEPSLPSRRIVDEEIGQPEGCGENLAGTEMLTLQVKAEVSDGGVTLFIGDSYILPEDGYYCVTRSPPFPGRGKRGFSDMSSWRDEQVGESGTYTYLVQAMEPKKVDKNDTPVLYPVAESMPITVELGKGVP